MRANPPSQGEAMAEQPENQRCENCRFYQKRAVYISPKGVTTYQDSDMVCKRRLVMITLDQVMHGENYLRNNPYQWCGEWEPDKPDTMDQQATQMARFILLGDRAAVEALIDRMIETREGNT